MSATVWYENSNETATLTNTFKLNGTPTDPSTVSCIITDPTGTATTETYNPGDITRTGEGVYKLDVACTVAGIWTYEWVGTGAVSDVVVGTWTVFAVAFNKLYVTVEELKSRHQISDTADDFEAQSAVEGACRSIDEVTGRYFWRGADTRTYVPIEIGSLDIDDLVSVTSFKTDDNADGTYETTWTTADYKLEVSPGVHNVSARGEQRPYTYVRCLGTRWFPVISPWGRQDLVQIEGVFGWPAVPTNVKTAAMIVAAELFKSKDAPFGVVGYGEFGIVRVRENPRVMKLLQRYIHPSKVGV